MPALDRYHIAVRNALIADGWTITDDPLHLKWGQRDMYVDFGASRLIAATRNEEEIAVEVKSFLGASEMQDFRDAIGQYVLYRALLERLYPDRTLFLAIRQSIYETLFEEPVGELMVQDQRLNLLVFDPSREVIEQWLS